MNPATITSRAAVLSSSGDPTRPRFLDEFAVVITEEGLEDIASAHVVWPTGQQARKNRDAVGSRKVSGRSAELRLPNKDLVSIIERHRPDELLALKGLSGMTTSPRGSLVYSTTEPDALRVLGSRLIAIAFEVHRSSATPIKRTKWDPDHDVQQVLLRASQALVLAEELNSRL